MKKFNSIWSSMEGRAWAAGMPYKEYIRHFDNKEAIHAPLDKDVYYELFKVLDEQMERSVTK